MKADLAHGQDFSFSRTSGETNIKVPSPLGFNHFTKGSPSPSGMLPARVRQTTTPPFRLNSSTMELFAGAKSRRHRNQPTSYLGRAAAPPPRMNQRRQSPGPGKGYPPTTPAASALWHRKPVEAVSNLNPPRLIVGQNAPKPRRPPPRGRQDRPRDKSG